MVTVVINTVHLAVLNRAYPYPCPRSWTWMGDMTTFTWQHNLKINITDINVCPWTSHMSLYNHNVLS